MIAAIFELADLWTTGIDAHEYACFLIRLFHDIAHGVPPDQYLWKPTSEVMHGGYTEPQKTRAKEEAVDVLTLDDEGCVLSESHGPRPPLERADDAGNGRQSPCSLEPSQDELEREATSHADELMPRQMHRLTGQPAPLRSSPLRRGRRPVTSDASGVAPERRLQSSLERGADLWSLPPIGLANGMTASIGAPPPTAPPRSHSPTGGMTQGIAQYSRLSHTSSGRVTDGVAPPTAGLSEEGLEGGLTTLLWRQRARPPATRPPTRPSAYPSEAPPATTRPLPATSRHPSTTIWRPATREGPPQGERRVMGMTKSVSSPAIEGGRHASRLLGARRDNLPPSKAERAALEEAMAATLLQALAARRDERGQNASGLRTSYLPQGYLLHATPHPTPHPMPPTSERHPERAEGLRAPLGLMRLNSMSTAARSTQAGAAKLVPHPPWPRAQHGAQPAAARPRQ